jgi:uncharacterized coiled-coil protein SlyX
MSEGRNDGINGGKTNMMNVKSTVIAVIGVGLFSVPAFAQGQGNDKMGGMMKGHRHHAWMEEMHQKMEAEMKAEDAELDKLVSEMNTATGEKKVDAIAAVVNKLVEQRKTMHQKMETMTEKMGARRRKWMEEKGTTSPSPSPSAKPSASPAVKS